MKKEVTDAVKEDVNFDREQILNKPDEVSKNGDANITTEHFKNKSNEETKESSQQVEKASQPGCSGIQLTNINPHDSHVTPQK